MVLRIGTTTTRNETTSAIKIVIKYSLSFSTSCLYDFHFKALCNQVRVFNEGNGFKAPEIGAPYSGSSDT
jgi:hypothetical protein